ncbi:chemotaxis protein CheA [Parasphingorhabdus sp. DH2-15]|uniref:chemotaxis protein CheA n=1 Tax=Parasphingorhabdus sp. DH2-15 TaxID=3444112 RepID=UPI003F683F55
MDDLQQEFILETRETLELMTAELIAWEAHPDHGSRLDTIFRFFHTVKGSAGFLALPRFEALAHEAENILALLRETKKPISSALVTAILALVDRISGLTNALEQGVEFYEDDDSHLVAQLQNAWTAMDHDAATEQKAVDDAGTEQKTETQSEAIGIAGQQNVARTIRMSLTLLDNMMNGVSDMVLARNEVARHIRDTDSDPALDLAFERLSACIADLRESVGRTRMQKLEGVFASLPRIVRDLGQELGKDVALECQGNEVELDREMIEMIRDPLTHIIRNSVDHGVESTQERIRAGKAQQATIAIHARQSGNHIVISIRDDGAGIDVDRLVAKAIAANVCTASEAASMTERQKLNLVFATGLSTSDSVSSISGRGVGMDVVRSNIDRIGGSIALQSKSGEGLNITIRVPLTLTVISCLMFSSGGQQFAIPQSAIREITMASGDTVQMRQLGDQHFASIRGQHLPVVGLADLLGLSEVDDDALEDDDPVLMVIDAGAGIHYILAVDHVMDQEDLVVRAGAPAIMASGIYAGTTLPDHGRPLLLIDPNGVAAQAGVSSADQSLLDMNEPANEADIEDSEDLAMLIFQDCQNDIRALPLSIIERVEDFGIEKIGHSGGKMRLTHDEKAIPLYGLKAVPDAASIKVIKLFDGNTAIYYAINDIVDMHRVNRKASLQPVGNVHEDSAISGVFIRDGQQIELIDPHWIFSQFDQDVHRNNDAAKPICLLQAADDGWTRQMLAPLVAKAGYDVRYDLREGEEATICIASEDTQNTSPASGAIIALRDKPTNHNNGNSVYRYDRIGLLGALQSHSAPRRAGESS